MIFYSRLFALFAFVSFAAALWSENPYAYLATLLCGAVSRTAWRKKWDEPPFSKYLPKILRRLPEES